ncbi:MAG TPA: hypothetical protein VNT26_16000, partial [Candidatus Sulfotelmatobacter sp.]|nr:hypothetical protein [Candidatus Sulfotelmatobacter sp.]
EALFQEVLTFTDYLTLHFPWQTEWAEQYAFSSLLAERQGLTTAPDFIHHYWGINWEVQAVLSQRPDLDLSELARSPAAFNQLLTQARELLQDPAYQRHLRQRKLKRSCQKRLGVLRALVLRSFPQIADRP